MRTTCNLYIPVLVILLIVSSFYLKELSHLAIERVHQSFFMLKYALIEDKYEEPSNCTLDLAEKQGMQYNQLYQESNRWSACYGDDYLLRFYETEIDQSSDNELLFFDVGANKGYTVAAWLSLWLPDLQVNPHRLYEFLQTKFHLNDCGACNDCQESSLEQFYWKKFTNKRVEIHAFEPQPNTYRLLQQVKRWTNLSSLYVHQLAISNKTGIGHMLKCPLGAEVCGLMTKNRADPQKKKSLRVGTMTLDYFTERYRIIRPIDLLKIDTEGFDPLVLQGAENLLNEHRIRLLIFEYHGIGVWKTTTLYQVINDLDRKGYSCYQIGRTGLFRLTGCWSSRFEIKSWSNILCVCRRERRLLMRIEQLLIKITR